jgi:hypothetical protein
MICGNCQKDHGSVEEVRSCYAGSFLAPTDAPEPATERQINYAQVLLHERIPWGQTAVLERDLGISAAEEHINSMSFADVSDFITKTKVQPKRQKRAKSGPKIAIDEDGMYLVDGNVIKVQWSGENHLYAKWLDPETGAFHYVPGGITKVKPEHKMTLEQAKEFGALYGVCCVCGRTLTNEQSIEDGIGPVCAGKF